MDDQTPNISGFIGVMPDTGGVQTTTYQPVRVQGRAGSALETDKEIAKKNRIIYIIFIILFGISLVITISFFMFANSQRASANQNFEAVPLVTGGSGQQSGGASTGLYPVTQLSPTAGVSVYLPSPTPKKGQEVASGTPTGRPTIPLFPSNTPIPTPTPSPIPTLRSRPATATTTPRATPTIATKWGISFAPNPKKIELEPLNAASTGCSTNCPTQNSNQLSYRTMKTYGTFRAPLQTGEVYCYRTNDTFFTIKRSSSQVERLCDYFDQSESRTVCARYGTNDTISAVIAPDVDPYSNCTNGSSPRVGNYVLRTKIFYSCPANMNFGSPDLSQCNASKEVFSEDLRLTD
jgi:hypothetical protein